MAYLFPPTPAGTLPPHTLRAFNTFKGLPESFIVWHHLAPWQPQAPDFLVLYEQNRALLVKVSPAAAGEAHPASQLLLLGDDRPPLGAAERRVLESFLQDLPGELQTRLPAVVLFPNIPDKALQLSRPEGEAAGITWLGREALGTDTAAWERLAAAAALLDPAAIERLRSAFSPEIVVHPNLTVRQPTPRRLEAGLTGFLLDYNQEAALKADLDLPAEEQALVRRFRLNLINGVAGSGKSLILLYRLRLLHALFPTWRFLVLTHNRALNRDLQARFYRLNGGLPENIAWETFYGWLYSHWPAQPKWVEPLGARRRMSFIRAVWLGLFQDTPEVSEELLRLEFDWIKDQLVFDRAAYLQAERRGRGVRLAPAQRELIYTAFERYQALLKDRKVVDWGDPPRHMWQFIQAGQVSLPEYDAVLVDEAQFFAPLWFEIVRRLVRPRQGHLFLAAAPTQGFLRYGASWKSLGLEVRGHSYHLQRSYRTTRQILDFATLFYRRRLSREGGAEGDHEDELVPDLLDMPAGVVPQVIPLDSPQDEIARVANEIISLVKQGVPRRDLLVLHANWEGARTLIGVLERKLGRLAAADPKEQYPGNYVRVTTLNAGTGLESPIVVLAGLHELFEEEQSLRLSDDDRQALIQENTRKVYMAATRAGQRLVFTYVGRLEGSLAALLPSSPT